MVARKLIFNIIGKTQDRKSKLYTQETTKKKKRYLSKKRRKRIISTMLLFGEVIRIQLVFQIIMSVVVLGLPLLAGSVFRSKSIGFTYLTGQFLMWGLFQIMAVPMIYFRTSFQLLFWVYVVAVTAISCVGLKSRLKIKFEKPEISLFLIIAILIILYQCYVYIAGYHKDEDDARWLAEANDALVKNKMLLHNPATGEYFVRFSSEMAKDLFSPWEMYLAVMSQVTGIGVAIVAHTIYAPVLLILSYLSYWEIGKSLFEKKEERGLFLVSVSIIYLFMGVNDYTQAHFSLVRIWQGKAVVAAVLIPVILAMFLKIQKNNQKTDWNILALISCAGCLLSGMGIAIGLVMVGVYGAYTVVCKRWNRIPYLILSTVPPIAYGLAYFWVKGG